MAKVAPAPLQVTEVDTRTPTPNDVQNGSLDDEDAGADRKWSKSYSNPPIFNYFDNRDPNSSVHVAHDHCTTRTLQHLAHACDDDGGAKHSSADGLKALDDEVCKVARRLKMLSTGQQQLSKRSASKRSSEPEALTLPGEEYQETWLEKYLVPILFLLAAIGILVGTIYWQETGNLHHDVGVHVHRLQTRVGFIRSPLHTASSSRTVIPLTGSKAYVFDIRLMVMASEVQAVAPADMAAFNGTIASPVVAPQGSLHYKILGDGLTAYKGEVVLQSDAEVEVFKTVDVFESLCKARFGTHWEPATQLCPVAKVFELEVWADTTDGQPVAFLCQIIQMDNIAKYRVLFGTVVSVVTFGFIISEVIHRVYSAIIGTCLMHFLIASLQETPHLQELFTTIDVPSLMLLFSTMILMHMLSLTGFFEWVTIRVVCLSRGSPTLLFFLLSNTSGVLGAFLDNCTVTLLTGPLAFRLAEMTGLKARPLYLAITIAASIGGSATMIGCPPNIVIASKLSVGFLQFLMYNGPLVAIMLPTSVGMIYFMFRGRIVDENKLDHNGCFVVNLERLKEENSIRDFATLRGMFVILLGVFVALCLTPLHEIDPAWFTTVGMFVAASVYHRHYIEDLLFAVEWDTLLFFAVLFVFVESMAEIGCIGAVGDVLESAIMAIDHDFRTMFSLGVMIWLSALGCSLVESLVYASVVISILIDLKSREIQGLDIEALVWSLSIGTCVGSIGSVFGSFSNLTAVAISERYGKQQEDKVLYWDFFRYGFPVLFVLVAVGMGYHWIIFVALGWAAA